MNKDKVTIKDIEKYSKELTRKHLREHGLRVFEHPSYSSALIVVKDDVILGMTGRHILSNNSKTQNIIIFNDYLDFEL